MNEVLQKLLLVIAVIPFLFLGCATTPITSENLYSVYSKDVDWIYLDVTISEIKRDEKTSLLKLKNFTHKSGMEGRFLFCFISRLAQQRGFRYLTYTEPLNDLVLVVFLKYENESLKSIIGGRFNEYSFHEEGRVVDLELEAFKMLKNMCGTKW